MSNKKIPPKQFYCQNRHILIRKDQIKYLFIIIFQNLKILDKDVVFLVSTGDSKLVREEI